MTGAGGLSLNRSFKEGGIMLRAEKNKKRGLSWANYTFGDLLRHRVATGDQRKKPHVWKSIDLQNLTDTQAAELIGVGAPHSVPGAKKGGKQASIGDRIESVMRKGGFLKELWDEWRHTPEAEAQNLDGVSMLQILSYKRGQAAYTGIGQAASRASAERGTESFKHYMTQKKNYSREQLDVISKIFGQRGHRDVWDDKFWRLPVEKQLAKMKPSAVGRGRRHTEWSPLNWVHVLETTFGVDVARDLGIKGKGDKKSYSDEDRARLWTALSGHMKALMQQSGGTAEATGTQIQMIAGSRSHSRDAPSRRSRTRSAEREPTGIPVIPSLEAIPEVTTAGAAETTLPAPPTETPRPKPTPSAPSAPSASAIDIPKDHFSKPGSYPLGDLIGKPVYTQWEEYIDAERSKRNSLDRLITISKVQENKLFEQFRNYHRRRQEQGGATQLPRLLRNKRNMDLGAFKTMLDKYAWNQYVKGMQDGGQAQHIRHIPSEQELFTGIFRNSDKDILSDMLKQWLGCRLYNFSFDRQHIYEQVLPNPMSASLLPLNLNTKENYGATELETARKYADLERRYANAGKHFPYARGGKQSWNILLVQNHQWEALDDRYNSLERALTQTQRTPALKRRTLSDAEKEQRKRQARLELEAAAEHTPETSPETVEAEAPSAPASEEGAPRRKKRGRKRAVSAEMKPEPQWELVGEDDNIGGWGSDYEAVPLDIPFFPGVERNPQMTGQRGWELGEIAAAQEEAIRAFYNSSHLPRRQHDNKLRAEVVHQRNYEALNGVHLLQTDNNIAPVMGAVHMVQPAQDYNDKHFMHDINADINEGQRVLVEKSRRGPFRDQTGRSTVMDSSAHVTYRKRAGVFEITVRRGVIASELRTLETKLNTHRLSGPGSRVTIIKGSRRYRLGPLDEINMRYLRELTVECVDQYGTCGLEITESQAGAGALYKGGAHGARIKSKARRSK